MKIFLLNPPFEGFCRTSECQFEVRGGWLYPPIELAYIAAVLRESDNQVMLLDAVAENAKIGDVLRDMELFTPDLVVVSCGTPTIFSDIETARSIKKEFPSVKILFYGSHATALPSEILRQEIDFVAIGEPELTIKELVEKRLEPENVNGLAYKKDKIIINPTRALIQNLDILPFPARDLLKNELYRLPYGRIPCTVVQSSRGCPFRCIFCTSMLVYGNKFRARSAESLLNEFKHLQEDLGIREVFFLDDTFTFDMERVEKFCDLLIESDIDISWSFQSRVDKVDKKLLRKMKDAGCYLAGFGVESGSQKILDSLRKGITLGQVRESFKNARDVGLSTGGFFIFGSPGETKEDIEKTVKLALELKPDLVKTSIMTPLPGTELFVNLDKEGKLLTKDWSKYEFTSSYVIKSNLKEDEIKDELKRFYRKFYIRPHYVLGQILKIKNFSDLRQKFRSFSSLSSFINKAN
ncbi:MAG: radical SAM protein [Methanocellales archaeon]|nr:radical SAM protein [Methanocellales archaeon]